MTFQPWREGTEVNAKGFKYMLQWGHDFSAMESPQQPLHVRLLQLASMGP